MSEKILLTIELLGIILLIFLILSFPSFKKLFQFESSNDVKKPERNKAIDFTRGVAMVAIVLIHVDSYFQFFHPNDIQSYFTRFIANISRYCVPAFILSSALFLSFKGTNQYWTGKLKSLFLPYIIIAIIGYFTKYPPFDFFNTIVPKIIFGQVFQPYYYVPLLFQFYLLYSLFFVNIATWSQKKFSIVLFTSGLINFLSNHYFPKGNIILHSFEVISFTNFIFFFVVGLSAKRLLTDREAFLNSIANFKLYKLALIFSAILYLIPVTYYSFLNKIEISNHFLFYPVLCFVLLTYFGLYLESKTGILKTKYIVLCYIGENSLAIFLLHPMVIHLMHMIDPYYLGGFYVSYIITLVLNISIPLILWKSSFYFINKISPKEVSK